MKKILAAVLACILAFCCCVSAVAVETADATGAASDMSAATVDCEYPLVIVRGMQFSGGVIDKGTENERSYMEKINVGDILSAVAQSVVQGMKSLSFDVFVRTLSLQMKDIFAGMACDADGNSAQNVSFEKYNGSFSQYVEEVSLGNGNEEGLLKAALARYGAENVYYFTYDWRLDPYELAAEVHETIETAKAEHSTDKVNYICCSMGGVITDAYLARFGWNSLNSCLFLSSTFKGTHCTTDLFAKKAMIAEPALNFMLRQKANNAASTAMVELLIRSGAVSTVCRIGNSFIEKCKDEVYDLMLRDTFATMPALWALVQPQELDACMDTMFPTETLKEEYSGVIDRAYRMHDIMENINATLHAAAADGVKISVVATYNSTCVPFYENADLQGDGTLESDYMLGGAVVSKIGATLGDGYQAADPAKLSPDRMVDLSPVVFPDSTWAIKNAPHVPAYPGSELTEFTFSLLEKAEQPTVQNMTGYSQFMAVDGAMNFVPLA